MLDLDYGTGKKGGLYLKADQGATTISEIEKWFKKIGVSYRKDGSNHFRISGFVDGKEVSITWSIKNPNHKKVEASESRILRCKLINAGIIKQRDQYLATYNKQTEPSPV